MHRREEGLTLVELLIVMIIISILVSFAAAFHFSGRERASDAAAKSNIRIALPAVEAFRAENGTYRGMTVNALRRSYSPGISITVRWTRPTSYCVGSTVNGRTWWTRGPQGTITRRRC